MLEPDVRGQPRSDLRGFELALRGSLQPIYGESVRVAGIAYEVRGASNLVPSANLRFKVSITEDNGSVRTTIVEQEVSGGARGEFEASIEFPNRVLVHPELRITLERGDVSREFSWPLGPIAPERIDFRSDRRLYEPGETVHLWSRLTHAESRAPLPNERVRLAIRNPSGAQIFERELTTQPSGVAAADFVLPESAQNGAYSANLESAHSSAAALSFDVGRRTVERLLARAELTSRIVRPGNPIRGEVFVTTPSGNPIRGATIELFDVERPESKTSLRTDAAGRASFRINAPGYLAQDREIRTLTARVHHASHGYVATNVSYTLTRAQWIVAGTPESGALVPEVDTYAFLSVTDPLDEPVAAGLRVMASGRAVRNGRAELVTDAAGLVVIPIHVPAGAYSAIAATSGSGCTGANATLIELDLGPSAEQSARACLPVQKDAEVLIRASSAIATPGADVTFEIVRGPKARGRDVFVEALVEGRAVSSALVTANRSSMTIVIPRSVTGIASLRARAMRAANETAPFAEKGATSLGAGSYADILIRPVDAFSLTLDPEHEVWRIGERARVRARGGQGWLALVVRDVAAHGGESDWALQWLQNGARPVLSDAKAEAAQTVLRAALAAGTQQDSEPLSPPPLNPPIWSPNRNYVSPYSPYEAIWRGELRDPLALREEFARRGIAYAMLSLERAVALASQGENQARGIVVRTGGQSRFDPNAIRNLVDGRRVDENAMKNLGGELLRVEEITEQDPSFTFDHVARRIARGRLVKILGALVRLTDPDDRNATRASAAIPPSRWISKAIELGLVQASDVVDPWGHPFALRESGAERVALAISDRAAGWELASAGPDGRFGTSDDVRDPFERIVPSGTPYAVASGEDRLMRALSALAVGNRVLAEMLQAYSTISHEAADELQQQAVRTTASEMEPEAMEGIAAGGLGDSGGTGRARMGRAQSAASPAPPPMEAPVAMQSLEERANAAGPTDRDADDLPAARVGGSRLQVAGERIRERFPATLFFAGEMGLDGDTNLEFPLADALTTYRVEAIAWTQTGWTTSAMTQVRVDQEAMIDAPVPAAVVSGDEIRLPVRVSNRTDQSLRVRVDATSEEVAIAVGESEEITVPPNEAAHASLRIRFSAEGHGNIVVRAIRADNQEPLDAVRRPIEVMRSARRVAELKREIADGPVVVPISVPEGASARGISEVRISQSSQIFAAQPADDLSNGWAARIEGREPPDAAKVAAYSLLSTGDPDADAIYGDPADVAFAISIAWKDRAVQDAVFLRALRMIRTHVPQFSSRDAILPPVVVNLAEILLALGPAARERNARPGVAQELGRVADFLETKVADGAARASDAPLAWVRAAAALSFAGSESARTTARELTRRLERHVIRVGNEIWLEDPADLSTPQSRIEPTILLAIARASLGDRPEAMMSIRNLIALARESELWTSRTCGLARGALAILQGRRQAAASVRLDGRPVALRHDESGSSATLSGLASPGEHELHVDLPEGSVAFVEVFVRYGIPWTAEPARGAPIVLSREGEVGARDVRSASTLEIRNASARALYRPVIEVDLPAGAELEAEETARLELLLRTRPTIEGRILRLEMRPLLPGATATVPLPVRWTVGGTISGFGAVAFDETSTQRGGAMPVAILRPMNLELSDTGREPAPVQGEVPSSDPPHRPEPPPPPVPPPHPIPIPRDPVILEGGAQ